MPDIYTANQKKHLAKGTVQVIEKAFPSVCESVQTRPVLEIPEGENPFDVGLIFLVHLEKELLN